MVTRFTKRFLQVLRHDVSRSIYHEYESREFDQVKTNEKPGEPVSRYNCGQRSALILAYHFDDMLKKTYIEQLVHPYGIDSAKLEFLQCSQNFVYKAHIDGIRRIVRICLGRYRSEAQVAAELDWINLLFENGIRACRPIPSREGKLFHSVIVDGKPAIVAVFEHAAGNQVERKLADETTFHLLGELTGGMHAAASQFNLSGEKIGRPSWKESRLLNEDFVECKHALSKAFLESVEDIVRRVSSVPTTTDSFGIVHGDISFVNIFEDERNLWIFDFDNCEYGYFVQDLATILWDSIYCKALDRFADDGLSNRMKPLWDALLKGYSKNAPAAEINHSQLKDFFLLREALIYVHYHRTLDVPKMTESFHRGLDVMKRNVENQEHQVDFSLISK